MLSPKEPVALYTPASLRLPQADSTRMVPLGGLLKRILMSLDTPPSLEDVKPQGACRLVHLGKLETQEDPHVIEHSPKPRGCDAPRSLEPCTHQQA
eukprot:200724-Pelagomonas_calceolata.AAC.1